MRAERTQNPGDTWLYNSYCKLVGTYPTSQTVSTLQSLIHLEPIDKRKNRTARICNVFLAGCIPATFCFGGKDPWRCLAQPAAQRTGSCLVEFRASAQIKRAVGRLNLRRGEIHNSRLQSEMVRERALLPSHHHPAAQLSLLTCGGDASQPVPHGRVIHGDH